MGQRAGTYAECVLEKGGAIDHCVGFIDGTGIFVARPREGLQRSVYSGHKRTHMLKLQSIVTPDGLLFHLAGPIEGRRCWNVMLNAAVSPAAVKKSKIQETRY